MSTDAKYYSTMIKDTSAGSIKAVSCLDISTIYIPNLEFMDILSNCDDKRCVIGSPTHNLDQGSF